MVVERRERYAYLFGGVVGLYSQIRVFEVDPLAVPIALERHLRERFPSGCLEIELGEVLDPIGLEQVKS